MNDSVKPTLSEALDVDRGIVCAVGAGGKKSLLYTLAREATGRVGVTATVMILRFPRRLGARIVVDDASELLQTLTRSGDKGLWAYAHPSDKRGRLSGLRPTDIVNIHTQGQFDLTLVKADGARMRGIKAPKPGEPVLPETTVCVLPVVSAGVIGQPLNAKVAHRPELLAEVIGAAADERLAAEHIGRLLASEQGALQATAGKRVVPVINQVDDDERLQQARAAAKRALALSTRFDRVVLTCLRRDNPVVETVIRS